MSQLQALNAALAMMRGDAEYKAMQETGGPTMAAAQSLSDLDNVNTRQLISGQARGDDRIGALIEMVNEQYHKAQIANEKLAPFDDFANSFGRDQYSQDHAEKQFRAYQADQSNMPDSMKKLVYGIPEYSDPLDGFVPDDFDPQGAYLNQNYAPRHQEQVRQVMADGR